MDVWVKHRRGVKLERGDLQSVAVESDVFSKCTSNVVVAISSMTFYFHPSMVLNGCCIKSEPVLPRNSFLHELKYKERSPLFKDHQIKNER